MLVLDRTNIVDQILGSAIEDFDIPDSMYELAVARYRHLGRWLADYWPETESGDLIYPQGSFRLGTVTAPINPADHYDIDLVCRRDLTKESVTKEGLKADVGYGISAYLDEGHPDGSPTQVGKKRCWTLEYHSEPFHMDILPAMPDVEKRPNGIILPDRDLREWQHSNPVDYASWFHKVMREEFLNLRVALSKKLEVDEVPEWRVKTTLQRAVQALKRHRDGYFRNDPDDKPASIIITTLAAHAYSGGDLYDVIVDVVRKMPELVTMESGIYIVRNPVQDGENFADRWVAHPAKADRFFQWAEQARADFVGVGSDLGVDRVVEKTAGFFGDHPARAAAEAVALSLASARDSGLLGMASRTGRLEPATTRSIKKHEFHGGSSRA